MLKRKEYLLLAIATLAMGALAISNQSFWIDEGTAALKAIQPTAGSWWEALRTEEHSNLQLLPHLFYLWGWEKIFGPSEISLRAANVPLLFIGLAGVLWALRNRPRLQLWFCLLALVNAFTWYYTSEARPYIFLFAASCLALGALIRFVDEPEQSLRSRPWFALFCLGTFMVSAISMIAVPFAISWLLSGLLLIGFSNSLPLVRRNMLTALLFCAAMILLAAYYLWTVSLGARASGIATTHLSNLFFVVYEQLGLAGLGPGRSELRLAGVRALQPYGIWLGLGLLASTWLSWEALRSIPHGWWRSRRAAAFMVATIVPLVVVLCAGRFAHVRILGRHLTPLFPIVLFVLALGMQRLQQKKSPISSIALVVIPLIFLASALQVRFAARHARDDYRGAASLAARALEQGGTIWWAADESTGEYYGVPLSKSRSGSGAIPLMTPAAVDIERELEPKMIVLSKPDIYDASAAITQYARAHGYATRHVLQSFLILQKPGPP